jgi:hypothetical protein
MNWIDRTYSGQERLWKVFWLGFIAPLIPLTIGLGVFKETSGSLPSWAAFVFFIVVFLYQAWLAIAMWRCAPNVKHRAFYFLGRLFAAFLVLMLLAAALQFLKGAP